MENNCTEPLKPEEQYLLDEFLLLEQRLIQTEEVLGNFAEMH